MIRAKEENRTRESSPRAPLCTPATRAIPLPLRKRPRRGRASRRRRPRSRSIPPCVPRDDADAATSGGAPREVKPKKRLACRFYSSAKAARRSEKVRAPAPLPRRLSRRLFIPAEDLESRRVRVSRRRFVSTPALFSILIVHTYCPRESLHPRRSKCRSEKGIVRTNASIFNPSIDPERSRCSRRCGEKGSMIGPKRLAQIPMRGSEAHSVDRSRTPCRIAGKARRAVRAA